VGQLALVEAEVVGYMPPANDCLGYILILTNLYNTFVLVHLDTYIVFNGKQRAHHTSIVILDEQ